MIARRLYRSGFVFLPMLVAAGYAAGCSDDDPTTPTEAEDAGVDVTSTPTDSGKQDGNTALDPRCVPDRQVDGLYQHLSCAGFYSDATTKTISPDLMPYKPSTEFWSDGAEKTRFLYLPPGTKIDSSDMNEWVFPTGTKVFKQFKIGGKLIETRLLQKFDDQWRATTYRWKADESDAERLEGGEQNPGLGPDGGIYEIPTTVACASACHGGRKDFLLGFDAVSLGLPEATGLTLASLVDRKLLTVDPPIKTLAYPAATAAQGGDKAGPAMAWLSINCGSACHNRNPNAGAHFSNLYLQIRSTELMPVDGGPVTVDKLDPYAMTVCQSSNRDETAPNTGLLKYVRSGVPSRSWISMVSGQRMPAAPIQMPPIATHAVDLVGHQRLDDWITALTPACPD